MRTDRRHFFRCHLCIKTIDLPRQARDKHRETSKKEGRFLCRRLHKSNISTSPLQLVTLADIPPSTAGAVLAVKTDADAEAYLLRGNNVHSSEKISLLDQKSISLKEESAPPFKCSISIDSDADVFIGGAGTPTSR